MLAFVKKSKEKISYIIVYSVDRFSRSGANAIYIAEKLKREGITVFAVTQPTDATTASGGLKQNIQFIFSEYDNQLRKEKCMAGVKEQLLNGIWCTAPPLGYTIIRNGGKKSIVLNQKGKLIRKAFLWKIEGFSNEAIKQKMSELGWNLPHQRISSLLRNPFYCGLLAHTALEGQLVEGTQESAISKEIFLSVNGILQKNTQGYNINPENDLIPLKRFLKCDVCGQYLRAYKAWKNKEYYYKCNTKGCACNKRADALHDAFKAQLDNFNIRADKDLAEIIKIQMAATYNRLNKDKEETAVTLSIQIKEIDTKLERYEERLMNEEIEKPMFDKYRSKLLAEKQEINTQLALSGNQVSNLDKCLDAVMLYACKLNTMWDCGTYIQKQQLQFLVFPDGMYYNRKKDECRTQRVNSVFLSIAQLASIIGENNSGNKKGASHVAALVARTGIEPVTPP